MNRLDVGDFGGAYYARNIQIAFGTIGRSYAHSFVGKLQIRGVSVGFGINHHCFDAKLMTGTNNTQRYLTAICNQDS
jgi:hypothetical protein